MILLLLACTTPLDSDSAPVAETPRGDCNPIQPENCRLPFPSSYFLRDDSSTPSGYRVDFGATSLPLSKRDVQMDPEAWNRKDGFPIVGPLYALLPGAVVDGSATFDNIAASVDGTATSVVADVDTGALVPHYIEREAFASDPLRAALVIHPAVPLEHAHRYAVGLRGFVDEGGALIPAPTGFATLRDGESTDDPDLERQRAGYEDRIFPALEAAGFSRQDLQLGWDFVTESETGGLSDMTTVRDLGMAQIPAGGPPYSIVSSVDYDCSGGGMGRVIKGQMEVPLFLDTGEPNAVMVRDADGLPTQNGTVEVPFTIGVTCSVLANPAGALLIQGGHGLFGTHNDVAGNPWAAVADAAHGITFGTSWRGLSEDDYPGIVDMMSNNPSNFHMISDQLMQAQFEALAIARLMKGDLATDENLSTDGVPFADTSRLVYLGVSLGTVVGGAQVALSPDVDTAVMMIPGAPFAGLLTRSSAFSLFLALLASRYEDPIDQSLIVPLAQMMFQPAETGGWAHSLVDGAAMGGRDGRRFLFQVGIADDTVTSIGGAGYARMVGASLIGPAPRDIWGVDPLVDPLAGSGVIEWDYGYTENPEPAPQDLDPDPHWLVPGEPEAVAQAAAFFTAGDLSSTCEGVCAREP